MLEMFWNVTSPLILAIIDWIRFETYINLFFKNQLHKRGESEEGGRVGNLFQILALEAGVARVARDTGETRVAREGEGGGQGGEGENGAWVARAPRAA